MVTETFDAVKFFRENASLFAVCNLFLFISLYVFSIEGSSAFDLNDNTKAFGAVLIFVSALMALFILIVISIQLWKGRKEEISIFSISRIGINIKQGDPVRLFLYLTFVAIGASFICFIPSSANPLQYFIIMFSILLIVGFLLGYFNLVLHISKFNLGKIQNELVLLKQKLEENHQQFLLLERKDDVQVGEYQLLLNNLREYRSSLFRLEDMFKRNRYYRHTNPPEVETMLHCEFRNCNLDLIRVLTAIIVIYYDRMNKINELMIAKRDYRVAWDKSIEITDLNNRIGPSISEIKQLLAEIVDECPEIVLDFAYLESRYLKIQNDYENIKKEIAVSKIFHSEP